MGPIVTAAIRRALSWLANPRRGKTVSKHIGHHTRSAANAAMRNPRYLGRALGRSAHSVFRDPRPRKLIERALANPTRTAVQNNGYVVVEKEFNRMIGRAGETAIRIIINPRTGRIVTAFPVRVGAAAALMVLPQSVVGAEFDDRVADTIQNIDRMIDHHLQSHRQSEPDLVTRILDFLLDPAIAGDPHEGLYVQIHHLVEFQVQELIREVERALSMSLGPAQRQEVAEQFRNAVAGATGTLDD